MFAVGQDLLANLENATVALLGFKFTVLEFMFSFVTLL